MEKVSEKKENKESRQSFSMSVKCIWSFEQFVEIRKLTFLFDVYKPYAYMFSTEINRFCMNILLAHFNARHRNDVKIVPNPNVCMFIVALQMC